MQNYSQICVNIPHLPRPLRNLLHPHRLYPARRMGLFRQVIAYTLYHLRRRKLNVTVTVNGPMDRVLAIHKHKVAVNLLVVVVMHLTRMGVPIVCVSHNPTVHILYLQNTMVR